MNMLKDEFYKITSINAESNVINATLVINETHKIFKGHFPGQPVVPGVCMMQMVKEITAIALEKELQLIKADELKFLQVIDPRGNKEIKVRIQYSSASATALSMSATLVIENSICFKLKGSFRIGQPQR
jgi:3-hydroxyacyl-[acyl-carrier-protein] dehydratase